MQIEVVHSQIALNCTNSIQYYTIEELRPLEHSSIVDCMNPPCRLISTCARVKYTRDLSVATQILVSQDLVDLDTFFHRNPTENYVHTEKMLYRYIKKHLDQLLPLPLTSKGDSLQLQKLVQSKFAVEASPSTLLDTAVRQTGLVVHRHLVDMHSARVNLSRQSDAPLQVFGEDGARKTILGIIGQLHGSFFRVDSHEGDRGAKGFGVVKVHLFRHVGHDEGADAVQICFLAVDVAVQEVGALVDGVLDQLLVLLDGRGGNEDRCFARIGIDFCDGGFQGHGKGLDDSLVDDDALGRHADLARVDKGSKRALEGSVFDICVFENEGRSLAAQLHQARLEFLTALGSDDGADSGATGEVDLLDLGCLDELVGDSRSVLGAVVQNVEAASRQTSLVEDASNGPEATGRELATLQDASVASGQRVHDRSQSQNVGSVPGGNSQNNTVRLLEDQSATLDSLGNDSGDAANTASDVSQHLDRCGQVEALDNELWCSRLLHLVSGQLFQTALHDVCGAQQHLADLGRLGLLP